MSATSTGTVPSSVRSPGAPTPPGGPPAADERRTGGSGSPAPARRPRGLARGGTAVLDVLVLAGAVVAALSPLLPVYDGTGGTGTVLAVPVLGGALLGAALGLLAAWARWSPPVTTVVLAVVAVLAGGPLATPDTTLGGVLPTGESLLSVVRGSVLGWKDVLTLQPPLGGSGWLLVPPYLLALVGTAVAVRLALGTGRTAPAAALLPLCCLGIAVLLGTHATVVPAVVGTALAVVLLTWAAWRAGGLRGRRPVALLVLLVLAAGAGLGGGALVDAQRDRFVLRDALVPPFDPRDYASPLSAFRAFVKDDDTVDLFTATGLPVGARIRLATFDRFDGVVWNVAGDGSSRASGEFRRVGETVDGQAVAGPGAGGTRAQVGIRVAGLDGVWLPTVGDTAAVRFGDAETQSRLRFNDATGAAVLTGGLADGVTYTLDAVLPTEPDDDAVADAAGRDLDLPEPQAVPEAVRSTAADVTREARTPVQVARALERALAEDGFFSHGLTDLGDYPSLSGHGADRMAALLGGELMVGDGEQYASAMALMARELGLPARVVLGFAPDDEDTGEEGTARDPDEPVVVTGADVRAWVEIAFEGHGWVTFDPTPPESQTPQDDTESSPADPEPQVVQPPPPPADPVDPPDDDTDQPQTQDGAEDAGLSLWQRIGVAAGIGAGMLLVLLAPLLAIALLKARRRRRRRRDAVPLRRVVGGWQEVLDLATDLRRPVDPVATRREGARELSRSFLEFGQDEVRPAGSSSAAATQVGTVVVALAERADAVVFGAGDPTAADAGEYWEQVDLALARMRTAAPRRQRWRGRFAIRSLRGGAAQRTTRRARPDTGADK